MFQIHLDGQNIMPQAGNILIFLGVFRLQIFCQLVDALVVGFATDDEVDRPAATSNNFSLSLYADLTEKTPFGSGCQAGKSSNPSWIGMARISSASISLKVCLTRS
jgi:hypothetical protein